MRGSALGAESGETRANYDDVDDYNGWTASPPELSDGTALSLGGYTRSAKIIHVVFDDPTTESGSYTGMKRITVTVSKNGTQLAQVSMLRTHSADQLGFVHQE